MNRRRIIVGTALLAAVALAFGGFYLFSTPLRDVEARIVLAVIRPAGRVSVVGDHYFQVLPQTHAAFRAQLTPFCSSLVPVLALTAIALFILHGRLFRRVWALALAIAVIVACNVVRIAASLWVGLEVGARGLVLFHDWVGTLFGIAYTMVGFFLMLFLLLPKATANIARAARVSDVL